MLLREIKRKNMKSAIVTSYLLFLLLMLTSFTTKTNFEDELYTQSQTGVASYYNDRHQGKKQPVENYTRTPNLRLPTVAFPLVQK
jgi:hypothetical protein